MIRLWICFLFTILFAENNNAQKSNSYYDSLLKFNKVYSDTDQWKIENNIDSLINFYKPKNPFTTIKLIDIYKCSGFGNVKGNYPCEWRNKYDKLQFDCFLIVEDYKKAYEILSRTLKYSDYYFNDLTKEPLTDSCIEKVKALQALFKQIFPKRLLKDNFNQILKNLKVDLTNTNENTLPRIYSEIFRTENDHHSTAYFSQPIYFPHFETKELSEKWKLLKAKRITTNDYLQYWISCNFLTRTIFYFAFMKAK